VHLLKYRHHYEWDYKVFWFDDDVDLLPLLLTENLGIVV